jgi:hypothetical protein
MTSFADGRWGERLHRLLVLLRLRRLLSSGVVRIRR